MTGILNTRILASLAMIVFVGAVVASSTGAFFSDTETSTGNTFTAGDIDLRIDNESYVTNNAGALVASPANSWAISDLTNQLFFSFGDVKPGDIGEDTISIHAGSNDAYACMAIDVTGTPENSLTEPETDADDQGPAFADNGELQNYLNFTFWYDDGDNVFEVGESVIPTLSNVAASALQGAWHVIADTSGGSPAVITGDSTRYIAKAWCFGTLSQDPEDVGDGNPISRGTGFICNGAGDGDQNDAQTDGVVMDVSFYAVQARNNAAFQCATLPTFVGQAPAQQTLVGSNFALYDAPDSCSITVNDADSLQAAVTNATSGQTVCVNPGTYDENVVVDESMTIAATGAVGSAVLNGGFQIEADNVTIKGFQVTGGAIGLGPTLSGFFLMNGSDNVNITDNDIAGPGSVGSRGIINAESGTFSNVLIENNDIRDWASAVYMSTITATNYVIRWNDIVVNGGAIGSTAGIGQLNDVFVTLNEFTSETLGGESIGADDSYDGGTVSFNNFLSDSTITTHGAVTPDVDAPNNFFGTPGAAAQTTGTDDIDFTPETGVQYGHR